MTKWSNSKFLELWELKDTMHVKHMAYYLALAKRAQEMVSMMIASIVISNIAIIFLRF